MAEKAGASAETVIPAADFARKGARGLSPGQRAILDRTDRSDRAYRRCASSPRSRTIIPRQPVRLPTASTTARSGRVPTLGWRPLGMHRRAAPALRARPACDRPGDAGGDARQFPDRRSSRCRRLHDRRQPSTRAAEPALRVVPPPTDQLRPGPARLRVPRCLARPAGRLRLLCLPRRRPDRARPVAIPQARVVRRPAWRPGAASAQPLRSRAAPGARSQSVHRRRFARRCDVAVSGRIRHAEGDRQPPRHDRDLSESEEPSCGLLFLECRPDASLVALSPISWTAISDSWAHWKAPPRWA